MSVRISAVHIHLLYPRNNNIYSSLRCPRATRRSICMLYSIVDSCTRTCLPWISIFYNWVLLRFAYLRCPRISALPSDMWNRASSKATKLNYFLGSNKSNINQSLPSDNCVALGQPVDPSVWYIQQMRNAYADVYRAYSCFSIFMFYSWVILVFKICCPWATYRPNCAAYSTAESCTRTYLSYIFMFYTWATLMFTCLRCTRATHPSIWQVYSVVWLGMWILLFLIYISLFCKRAL